MFRVQEVHCLGFLGPKIKFGLALWRCKFIFLCFWAPNAVLFHALGPNFLSQDMCGFPCGVFAMNLSEVCLDWPHLIQREPCMPNERTQVCHGGIESVKTAAFVPSWWPLQFILRLPCSVSVSQAEVLVLLCTSGTSKRSCLGVAVTLDGLLIVNCRLWTCGLWRVDCGL